MGTSDYRTFASPGAEPDTLLRLLAERTAALAALRESEERFRGAFEQASVGLALVAPDGRWLKVNRSLCEILGYDEAELLATDFQAITHAEDLEQDVRLAGRLLRGGLRDYQITKRYLHKRGHVVWVLLSVTLVRDAAGAPLHFISQMQDLTEQKRAEWLEADGRAVLELVARGRPLEEVLERLGALLGRQAWDMQAALVLGQKPGQAPARVVAPGLPPGLAGALERHASDFAAAFQAGAAADEHGAPRAVDLAGGWPAASASAAATEVRDGALAAGLRSCSAVPVRSNDGEPLGFLAAFCRETRPPTAHEAGVMRTAARLTALAVEHRRLADQLARRATHDPLTGLPNRALLQERLEHAVALARRNGRRTALLAIDLDHFKRVNDTLGHAAGDSLLQQLALRLRSRLRATDTLARVGGDEFLLLLPDLNPAPGNEGNNEGNEAGGDAGPAAAPTNPTVAVARKLVEALSTPFEVLGHEISATGSIGIAIYPDDGPDAAAIQHSADAAMYKAKRQGRNGFALATAA